MAYPLLWYGRPPAIGNKYPALRRWFRNAGADYLFTVCHCHLSRQIVSHSFYTEIMKYATTILVCGIAVSKSQEFLLEVSRLFIFFSTTTPPSSRRRVIIFSTTSNDKSMFFRRRRTLVSSDDDDTGADIVTNIFFAGTKRTMCLLLGQDSLLSVTFLYFCCVESMLQCLAPL